MTAQHDIPTCPFCNKPIKPGSAEGERAYIVRAGVRFTGNLAHERCYMERRGEARATDTPGAEQAGFDFFEGAQGQEVA